MLSLQFVELTSISFEIKFWAEFVTSGSQKFKVNYASYGEGQVFESAKGQVIVNPLAFWQL